MSTTVTIKGQVTIPKSVRELLGLKPGSKVSFVRSDSGEVIIKPEKQKSTKTRFNRFRGHAGRGMSTDEIMELTRGNG